MKILFLLPYPLHQAPSQRFRVEQYLDLLKAKGHDIRLQSFLEKPVVTAALIAKGFLRRIGMIFGASRYDFIFIHREAAPIGPPIIEWFLARLLRKKIIFDYDDAIWLTDNVNEPAVKRILKWRTKVRTICRWSYKVSCGNAWLADFALEVNDNVVLNPTTIDTIALHRRELYGLPKPSPADRDQIVIGWTGSFTTVKYLSPLEPVLFYLEKKYPHLQFLVIADRPAHLNVANISFRQWSLATEISDLLKVDVGVMPLPDDTWSKGKCGFKALQYMALEIPVVLSPVGANVSIVSDGRDGFFATSEKEWTERLVQLIEDTALRRAMGKEGRQTVESRYSVTSNSSTFLSLFE